MYHNARIDGTPAFPESESDTLVRLVVLALQSGKLPTVLDCLLLDGRLIRMILERVHLQLVDVLHPAKGIHHEKRAVGSKFLAVVVDVIDVDAQDWFARNAPVFGRCDAVDAACGWIDEQFAGPVRFPQDFKVGYSPVGSL